MTSTGPKRTHHQIQRDRQDIADWYCQGLTQAAIAARINDNEQGYTLSQQTISNDIRAIQKAWLKSSLRDFDTLRAEQLGKVDRLEREYWRGWERSCLDTETTVRRQKQDGVKEQQKTSQVQVGNPAFLAGVERQIDRRIKLLGLNAPERIAMTDPTGRKSAPVTNEATASVLADLVRQMGYAVTDDAEPSGGE